MAERHSNPGIRLSGAGKKGIEAKQVKKESSLETMTLDEDRTYVINSTA
jgi:hypothetical protein